MRVDVLRRGGDARGMLRALALIALLGFASLGWAAEPSTPYGHNPEAGRYAAVEGIRLYYEIYGTGAPLVVLHGNGGSMEAMRFQTDFFRASRQVIAVDSRGHGRSELGVRELTYEQMADDVAALLRHLQVGPADVLGWSDGGIVALWLARRHPATVRRLVVSGANLSPADLKPTDLAGMRAELRDVEAKLAVGDTAQPWAVRRQHLRLMIEQRPITAADLAAIAVPVLVLAGEHDMIPEPHTRAIAQGLPRGRLHLFPGAGHGVLLEIPETFNAIVDAFLRAPDPT